MDEKREKLEERVKERRGRDGVRRRKGGHGKRGDRGNGSHWQRSLTAAASGVAAVSAAEAPAASAALETGHVGSGDGIWDGFPKQPATAPAVARIIRIPILILIIISSFFRRCMGLTSLHY